MSWVKVIGAVTALALAFLAGSEFTARGKDAEIAEIRRAAAAADLASANQALSDLSTAGATIRQKADELRGVQSTLANKLDAIHEDMKNAKPLPADCRPDDQRLRNLTDAVDAAKQAAAAR